MKKIQRPVYSVCTLLFIAFLLLGSVFSSIAQNQNIATSFSSAKVNSPSLRDQNALLSVYPNPVADEAKLVFYSTKYDAPYQVRIVSNNGASLKSIQGTTVQGQNTIRIHVGNYPPGAYYVQLVTAESRETLKLLKQPLNSF